jgi:hypothetical protein
MTDNNGDSSWFVELPYKDDSSASKKPDLRGQVRADRALEELANELELWRSPSSVPYATVPVEDHFENWPVESSRFKDWLRWRAQLRGEPLMNTSDLEKLVGGLRAKA